jgi:hypothetical protein
VTVTSVYHIPKSNEKPTDDKFTYRARRVQIQPSIEFPPPPSDLDDNEEPFSPLSSKRPSHNLLSNIAPSIISSPSSETSSRRGASSFGFEARPTTDNNTLRSLSDSDTSNGPSDDESQQIDYLCKSTSTLAWPSTPATHPYYA